jgi:hypothetical protein
LADEQLAKSCLLTSNMSDILGSSASALFFDAGGIYDNETYDFLKHSPSADT